MSEAIINTPDVWASELRWPKEAGHKYHRGHAIILGAPELIGATRLAAEACLRIGAGLVSVVAKSNANLYRTSLLPDIMVPSPETIKTKSVTSMLAGPGRLAPGLVDMISDSDVECIRILDAEAIGEVGRASGIAQCILTPHDGEFDHWFPDLAGTREERIIQAAKQAGAIIVLKGPRTLIASPEGKLVENRHASPWLAKAGTGDVLSGFVAGLTAQGMPPFEAACAAVWIHGDCALRFGPGLIASDLSGQVPAVLKDLPAQI